MFEWWGRSREGLPSLCFGCLRRLELTLPTHTPHPAPPTPLNATPNRLVKAGEHILAGDDIYGGTSRLLSAVVPAAGVSVSNVDMTDLAAVRAALRPGVTKLVMVESPTNPRMQARYPPAPSLFAFAFGAATRAPARTRSSRLRWRPHPPSHKTL